MTVCVIYNPSNLRSKAIIVNIPGNPNSAYAIAVAKREMKKHPGYNKITCNTSVIGKEDNVEYVGYTKRGYHYVPVAVSDNPNKLITFYGIDTIISPLEKMIINTLDELISGMS